MTLQQIGDQAIYYAHYDLILFVKFDKRIDPSNANIIF